jgi:hypothetical protein
MSDQSTVQNCFVKCGHVKKNLEGSDMTKVNGSGEDSSAEGKHHWYVLQLLQICGPGACDVWYAVFGRNVWCCGKFEKERCY